MNIIPTFKPQLESTLGKMYFQLLTLLTILFCLCSRYSPVEIKPELQRNILKFGYGINYKYEGMLAHSFDRFYVITKFFSPTLDDLKLYPIKYDKDCQYLRNLDDEDNDRIKQNMKDLLFYCAKLRPYMALYKMQITACNLTAQKILKNEVDLILLKFKVQRRNKRAIFGAIILGFLGLASEGISSFLHQKRHRTLQKAVKLMSVTIDAQRNKLIHLENSLIMYGVYNAETLSKLVKTAYIYLLESLAACHDSRPKLVMYFMVNLACTVNKCLLNNYLQVNRYWHTKFIPKCKALTESNIM